MKKSIRTESLKNSNFCRDLMRDPLTFKEQNILLEISRLAAKNRPLQAKGRVMVPSRA